MNTVAALLKNGRENKNLKTREVATLLKIDQALISKFENGQRRPTKFQLNQLSALFEIDLEMLTILWIKEKLLSEISNEVFGIKAFEAAATELNLLQPSQNNEAINALFNEMDTLRNKLENLRDGNR